MYPKGENKKIRICLKFTPIKIFSNGNTVVKNNIIEPKGFCVTGCCRKQCPRSIYSPGCPGIGCPAAPGFAPGPAQKTTKNHQSIAFAVNVTLLKITQGIKVMKKRMFSETALFFRSLSKFL